MNTGLIPITKYVDIISVFEGGDAGTTREPIARLFTENALAPFGSVLEFSSLENVKAYFGASSSEYDLAQKYFTRISKLNTYPQKISFARYATEGLAASLTSGITTFNLDTIKAVTQGSLTLSYSALGGSPKNFTASNLDFSSAATLADVASTLQTAISAVITGATVEYSTDLNGGRFVLSAANSEDGSFSAATGDVAELLGWSAATGVINSSGTAVISLGENLDLIVGANDNFYTFAFVNALELDDAAEVSQWNSARNCDFFYVCQIPSAAVNYTDFQTELSNDTGTLLVYDTTNESQFIIPMAAIAAIDFNEEHAVIDLMFQGAEGFTPNNLADKIGGVPRWQVLDNLNINYYAATQYAGTPLAFFQNGVLQGDVASASVYLGAIWLKASIISKCMEVFRLNNAIYANKADAAKLAAACSTIWDKAVKNGSILAGKALSDSEKAAIAQLTGDSSAWSTIESQGFIFQYEVRTKTDTGQKYFWYRLVYAGTDTIHSVEGTNTGISSTAA